jgi:hypothetical protein
MKKFLLFMVLVYTVFYTCTYDIAGGSDETSSGIGLCGYVYYKENNLPAPNIIAKLKHIGFYTITDKDGYYRIAVTKDTLQKLGINIDTIRDTVEYYQGNTIVDKVTVTDWIDTLPAVYIIQRNIYGKFLGDNKNIGRIEAVLAKIKNSDTVSVKRVRLWFNVPAMGFSGFAYFQHTTDQYKYSVYINAYDTDSLLTGRSQTVEFSDIAGDIEIPVFNPFNARPDVFAGKDTTVSINDTIRLHPSVCDSIAQARILTTWEWSIGGNCFVRTSTFDTTFPAPADSNAQYACILRVTDNDTNVVIDTMLITVCKDVPIADAGNDTVAYRDSLVTLHGNAIQKFGTIVTWEWNIGGNGFKETSSGDTIITIPDINSYKYLCIVRATDDDGNSDVDTVCISIVKRWEQVADKVSDARALNPSLSMLNGIPYIAFCEYVNNWIITVKKFNGTQWIPVGNGILSDNAARFPSLYIVNNTPFVAYIINKTTSADAIEVKKYNGSQWETIGPQITSTGYLSDMSLSVWNDMPYIAYREYNNGWKATMMKYTGTQWDPVGKKGFSDSGVGVLSFYMGNGIPYAGYTDEAFNYKATVMKYSGTGWEPIGAKGFSETYVNYTSVSVSHDTPYIAYQDNGNGGGATVMKFNGTQWESVGKKSFTDCPANVKSLFFSEGTPYIAYCYQLWNMQKAAVMKFNGKDWVMVGDKGFNKGSVEEVSFFIDNNIPYIAFVGDYNNGFSVIVMRYR